MLQKYRKEIKECFSKEEKKELRENPVKIMGVDQLQALCLYRDKERASVILLRADV